MNEDQNITDVELDALLADPALWAQPSSGLDVRVVAAVREAARPLAPASSLLERRRFSAPLAALLGAAAACIVTIGAVRVIGRTPVQATSALVSPPGGAGATGAAKMRETNSGWEIRLNTTGLKRLDKPLYYEAWVFGPKGDVSIGTFHTGTDVVLWAGVELDEYPELIITIESEDNNPSASDQRALVGPIIFEKK